MTLIFKPAAEETLRDIVEFIDDMNVFGAGERWAVKFIDFLLSFSDIKTIKKHPLCTNESLAFAGLSCLHYKGWIVAFKIEKTNLVIYQIIKGELLY